MNHRYADCQNADPDDNGDCACMGTQSDLLRQLHAAEAEVAGYMRMQEEMADKVYAAEGECERLRAERVGAEETVALHRPGIERQLKQAIDTLKEIAALDPYGDTDNDDNIITAQRIAYNALAALDDPPGPEAKG